MLEANMPVITIGIIPEIKFRTVTSVTTEVFQAQAFLSKPKVDLSGKLTVLLPVLLPQGPQ